MSLVATQHPPGRRLAPARVGELGGRAAPAALLVVFIAIQVALVRAARRRLAADGGPEHAAMLRLPLGLIPAIHIARRARANEALDTDRSACLLILAAGLGCLTRGFMACTGPHEVFAGWRATGVSAIQDQRPQEPPDLAAGRRPLRASEPGMR